MGVYLGEEEGNNYILVCHCLHEYSLLFWWVWGYLSSQTDEEFVPFTVKKKKVCLGELILTVMGGRFVVLSEVLVPSTFDI